MSQRIQSKNVKSKVYSTKILLEQSPEILTQNLLVANNAVNQSEKDLCRKIVSQIAEKSLEEVCREIHPATLAGLQGASFNHRQAETVFEEEGLCLSPVVKAALIKKAANRLDEFSC